MRKPRRRRESHSDNIEKEMRCTIFPMAFAVTDQPMGEGPG